MVGEYDAQEVPEGPPSHNDRTTAMLAHLGGFFTSILLPMVLLLVQNDSKGFVARHSREALNFQIAQYIYAGLMTLISGVAFFAFDSAMGRQAALIAAIVSVVIIVLLFLLYEVIVIALACRAALNGREFRYPANIRLV